jgi:hypothetical protein
LQHYRNQISVCYEQPSDVDVQSGEVYVAFGKCYRTGEGVDVGAGERLNKMDFTHTRREN